MSANFTGNWYNQHGSQMTLQVDTAGAVRGTYQTGVGLAAPDERFSLLGFASDDLIAFTVNFGAHGCLTSWAGQHTRDDSGERLETMWYLARNIADADEPQRLWGGIWSGADVFRRAPYATLAARPRPGIPSHPVKLRDR